MMKRLIILLLAVSAVSCMDIENINPYSDDLHEMSVRVSMPWGLGQAEMKGIVIKVEDVSNGNPFEAVTDSEGVAKFTLPNGLYMISATHSANDELYSGSEDRVRISGEGRTVALMLTKIKTGDILIKELYCGGCKKLPQEGEYQGDKYMILHNNSETVQYLDGLCLGMISPPNATAVNPWVKKDPDTGSSVFPEFVPIFEAVWQFGGDGQTFPLAPGEDAVIALLGAIDHAAQYPLSVNLNNEEYFTCYNTTYFPNTNYHPAPGDKIRQERILNVVIKTGQSNAFPVSISSPGMAIFRAQDTTMQEFVQSSDNVINIPGSSNGNRVTCIPYDWIIDAVEVFDGRSSNNVKRFPPVIDGGYVYLSGTYMGHSLMRRVNQAKTQTLGYEVLVDTNNSSNDFYERDTQSLRNVMEGESNE